MPRPNLWNLSSRGSIRRDLIHSIGRRSNDRTHLYILREKVLNPTSGNLTVELMVCMSLSMALEDVTI